MINLLMVFLIGGFVQKWYLPIGCASGISWKVLVADADRDNCYELYISDFQLPDYIYVCELHLPSTWEIDSFTNTREQGATDIGDFDNDGLYDLLQCGCVAPGIPPVIMFITESCDSFSYPVNEVWRDTVGGPTSTQSVFEIDQDGKMEIVKDRPEPYGEIGIYENMIDNQYNLSFTDTTSYGAPSATHAFGDFDQDEHNEVVFAGADETYWIYESPANNTYERVRFDTLPTHNIRDCFEVPDMDGDGKWEFVIKGFWVFDGIDAFIFEATGNNTYDTIKVFHFPGGDYYGGHSDAGDVDGDSVPEIVLEARQNVYIIKAAGNDSFYVWETLPGNTAGFNIKIYDLDNNGLNDIIMSSEQQTWIYEYDGGGVEEANKREIKSEKLEIFPKPFTRNLTIRFQISNNKYQMNVKDQNYVQSSKPKGLPYIRIFDIAGRLVKAFNNLSVNQHSGIQPFNQVVWNGLDDTGYPVPAGVYFVRLEDKDAGITEKIILLK